AGAGLASQIAQVELPIGGRRVEPEDIRHLLLAARDVIQPEGRGVLQAQPAHYTLDGAHGVADPQGLHAQSLGVDIHVLMADAAPLRNLTESVQNAHLQVEEVVGSPVAAGIACLSEEERELGVALVEFGAEVTSVSLFAGGMLVGLACLPSGSGDITDAIASSFGIRRFQAERLKCVNGSAIATPADHREMIPIAAPGDEAPPPASLHADERGRISRADLIAVITSRLGLLMEEINKALKAMGYTGVRGAQVVFTGGGAELAGLAEFAQGALGRPVRIGRPVPVKGLPEAHTTPGYSALVGLVLQAAAQPLDIRRLAPPRAVAGERGLQGQARRILRALRDYF
ncbi:MAG TPA: cell division protein FtsA, partial [Novosphingobium sp.]|nr:cell division protein FtsA [Novosphingobium sp.]